MADRSDSDLLQASDDLYYEYDMMRQLAALLSRVAPDPTVETNARLEAFLVHIRNLMVFLHWQKSNHPEDVRAKHYVQDWQQQPPGEDWVEATYGEVCNRVTHLSYGRIGPLRKEWPIREITEAIETELFRLIKLVPGHLLCPRWKRPVEYTFSKHSPEFPSVATGLSESFTLLNSIPSKARR